LLKTIENFQSKLEQGHDRWTLTLKKRRKMQKYLNGLEAALKDLIAKVVSTNNENDERLRTLNSLLAIKVSTSSESFFTQFKAFLDIMQLDGRSDELNQQIDRIFAVEIAQELCSVTRKAAELESQRNTRIRISLETVDSNIPTCRELEQGFSSTAEASTPLNQNMNIMSHLVFKVLGLSNDPI